MGFVFHLEGWGDGASFSAYPKKKQRLGPISIFGEHIDSTGVGNEELQYGPALYLYIVSNKFTPIAYIAPLLLPQQQTPFLPFPLYNPRTQRPTHPTIIRL